MSSGTRYESDGARKVIASTAREVMGKVARLGMTPRQQELNRLYAFYRCVQYDAFRVDWDGSPRTDPVERESIATSGFTPPGYYDPGGQMLPIKFKRPTAPYHIVKAVVDRFSGLLFSERRHPSFRVDGDPDAEAFAASLAQASRLWSEMIKARALGGAMGSVAIGFQFVDGVPRVEVFDPRWVHPEFVDHATYEVRSVEVRYMVPRDERDPDTREWVERAYWYRRTIDGEADTLYKLAPVTDEEPDWEVERQEDHRLGFCPVVWVQNLPVIDSVDGDPDCQGAFDLSETFDALQAQAVMGTLKNCDPTRIVTTDAALAALPKGSDNAVKLPKGSDVKFLEINGQSIRTATDLCAVLRTQILEVCSCVLEHPDVANKTATEVERTYESMYARADVLREQYGQRGVVPLVRMMVRAARLKTGVSRQDDAMVRGSLRLPPRVVDGRPAEVKVPDGDPNVDLAWPAYAVPSAQEAGQAITAATLALTGGVTDLAHAVQFVAPYLSVQDVPSLVKTLAAEREKHQADVASGMLQPVPGEGQVVPHPASFAGSQ